MIGDHGTRSIFVCAKYGVVHSYTGLLQDKVLIVFPPRTIKYHPKKTLLEKGSVFSVVPIARKLHILIGVEQHATSRSSYEVTTHLFRFQDITKKCTEATVPTYATTSLRSSQKERPGYPARNLHSRESCCRCDCSFHWLVPEPELR